LESSQDLELAKGKSHPEPNEEAKKMGISGFVVDRLTAGGSRFSTKPNASVQQLPLAAIARGWRKCKVSGSVELQTQNQSPLQAAGYHFLPDSFRSDTSVAKLNSCELRS